MPNQRIICSETVSKGKVTLVISLLATVLEPVGAATKLTVTAQLTSLAGDDMINGAKFGHNASLDNLVTAVVDASPLSF